MRARRLVFALLIWLMAGGGAAPALAHPAPFSYLDVRLSASAIEGALMLHDFDVAHELDVSSDTVLDPASLDTHKARITALVLDRLRMNADGRDLTWEISDVRALPEQMAIEVSYRVLVQTTIGHLTIHAALFPYDPNHQTFVNVYEDGVLKHQEVLGGAHTTCEYYTGGRQGAFAVFKAFTAAGIHHIAIGPDHILFIVGLLLLGGSVLRLLGIVSAFTIGHSITLSLAALNIVAPPARIVEPAIALSIVYVGADNLLATKGARMCAR